MTAQPCIGDSATQPPGISHPATVCKHNLIEQLCSDFNHQTTTTVHLLQQQAQQCPGKPVFFPKTLSVITDTHPQPVASSAEAEGFPFAGAQVYARQNGLFSSLLFLPL